MGRFHSNPQRSFADPEVLLQQRPLRDDSFEVRFRKMADELLPDSLFEELYSATGRPPISPSALTRILLLQLRNGRSDREALEDLNYDVRWQYMCDLATDECDFHPTVLCYFRLRLLFGTINRERIAWMKEQGGDLLERAPAMRVIEHLLEFAVKVGILDPERAQGIDSTAIIGAAQAQDCFRLIFRAIRQTLQACAKAAPEQQEKLLSQMRRNEYLSREQTKPVIEWSQKAAREALLAEYVLDAATLKAACEELDDEAVKASLKELLGLIDQDLLVAASGAVSVKQQVATGRQCSVVDKQMRHGRKSKSKRFNGFKGHVMVEPVSGLVTAATVTAASTHDSQAVEALLKQSGAEVVVGDNAYAVLEVQQNALKAGTAIVTPTSPLQPFEKDAFALDEDAGTLTCPNGITAKLRPSGKVRFPITACRACPLRELCQPGKRGREFGIRPGETLVRDLRGYARSEKGRELVRQIRPATERIIGHLVRCGIRQARYYGRLKTGLQTLLGVISYNLDKIGRRWLTRDSGGASGQPGSTSEAPNGCLRGATTGLRGRWRPLRRPERPRPPRGAYRPTFAIWGRRLPQMAPSSAAC